MIVSSWQNTHTDATDLPDFLSIASPQISIQYHRQGYIGTVAQIVYGNTDAERWFFYHPDTHAWVEIDREQRWFWTTPWQQKEQEADEDLSQGRYADFESLDDLFDI
jgi:hypothetical protein